MPQGMRSSSTLIICSLLTLVFFSVVSRSASGADPENKTVKVCYLNWGKQGGEGLPAKGFIPDLLSTVLREAGYEPVVDIIPWVRCLELVKTQRYDFVGSYWVGGEGDQWFDYFLPTTVDRINFITTKDTGITSGRLEDLYGKRIGFLKGAGGLMIFRDQIDKFVAIEVSNDQALIQMLNSGRIDAILSNSPHILSLAEVSFPDMVNDIVILQPPVQSNIASPAIAIDNPRRQEMKERYNHAYLKLVSEGLYPRLMKKHDIRVDYEMTENDRRIFLGAQK